jgi:hypothetical protein
MHASAHHCALEISRLRSLDYDILDVKSTHWHDDFSAYKNSVKDLEVMFQNVINTAFKGAPTTQAGVELLDAFTTLSYRDAIKRCVEKEFAEVFQSVTAELSLVKKGFDRHRGAPPMLHRDNPCSLLLLRIQWQWAMLENSAKTKEDMAKTTPEANQAMEAKTKDIMANWLVRNQKTIAELPLVDMPSGGEGEETGLLPLDKFVDMQVKFSEEQTATLSAKSIEIEHALKDLIVQIMEYPLSFVQESVDPAEIAKLSEHFSTTSYKAVQDCTRLSLETLKGRIAARSLATFLFIDKPLFEVSVEMTPKGAKMNPELGEIQTAINTVVRAVLSCSKQISLWENDDNYASGKNVFDVVSKDKDVVRVVLLLTGALEGVKRQVYEYMHTMTKYDYLWKDNKKAAYNAFMSKDPSLEDFEAELKKYDLVEHEIMRIPQKHNIGAIALETLALKTALSTEAKTWKKQYAQNLHGQARTELATITEWIEKHTRYLKRELNDLSTTCASPWATSRPSARRRRCSTHGVRPHPREVQPAHQVQRRHPEGGD